jgi:hypothetical protein
MARKIQFLRVTLYYSFTKSDSSTKTRQAPLAY